MVSHLTTKRSRLFCVVFWFVVQVFSVGVVDITIIRTPLIQLYLLVCVQEAHIIVLYVGLYQYD